MTPAELRETLEREFPHRRSDLQPKTLWHYTDSAGLKGILSTAEIWATHFAHTNDAEELRFGHDMVARAFTESGIPTTGLQGVRPAAVAQSIELSTLLESSTPTIMGDAARLQQIVWNLLSNAVKFTPKGGRIRVLLRRVESSVKIEVADTGAGISAAFLPSVFDAFRQEDASTARSRGGLGLGLAITRQLVELQGGRIRVESHGEGLGATFTVSLPILTVSSQAQAMASRNSRQFSADSSFARPPHIRGLRVLVVDDEEDARRLIAAILEDCGCHVTTAPNVEQAMLRLAEEVPHMVLSDIGMPGEDGYDLIRKLRALPKARGGDVPAAALTAYARPEDRRRMLNAGYSFHLAKPVEPAELVAVVATLSRFIQRDGIPN
jgi:CheY-like chemotaxis protein